METSDTAMKTIRKSDIYELYERKYSIYDSEEDKRSALDELRFSHYQIFNEEGTALLRQTFREEFDRLSSKVSFPSLQNMANTGNLWPQKRERPSNAVKRKLAEIIGSLLSICS